MIVTKDLLIKLDACSEAIGWFDEFGRPTVEENIALLRKQQHEEAFVWPNWFLSRVLNSKNKINYAIYAAELVQHHFENKYPNDNRPRAAIEAAKNRLCSASASASASAAAYAADAAYAAYAAASASAYAASASASASAYAAAAYAADADDDADDDAVKQKIINYGMRLLDEQNQERG